LEHEQKVFISGLFKTGSGYDDVKFPIFSLAKINFLPTLLIGNYEQHEFINDRRVQ